MQKREQWEIEPNRTLTLTLTLSPPSWIEP